MKIPVMLNRGPEGRDMVCSIQRLTERVAPKGSGEAGQDERTGLGLSLIP